MDVSKENLELIEKIKQYRISKKDEQILNHENQLLKKQNEEYKKALIDLSKEVIDEKKLLNKIGELEDQNRKLQLERKRIESRYDFIITTPNDSSSVYAEIRENLSHAQKEVLVCSPWITYLVDEFSNFNKNIDLKVIANFRKEDVKSGITDLDKFRVLKKLGAEIRYNNDLHAKMVFIDSKVAIISSANLTRKGLSVNYEAGVVIKNQDKIKKALKFFYGVWNESKPLTEKMILEVGG